MTRAERDAAVTLRAAVVADLDGVAAIERESFSDPWTRRAFGDLLAQRHATFLVAVDQLAILGYIVAFHVADEAEIANIAVAALARRRGIGRLLLDAVLDEGARHGTVRTYLEVRESNAAARALYASRGFREIGRRARYYSRPLEDAIVMRRSPSEG